MIFAKEDAELKAANERLKDRKTKKIGKASDADVEAAWMPEKTPEERARIVAHIRSVEVKWAKRLVVFIQPPKAPS